MIDIGVKLDILIEPSDISACHRLGSKTKVRSKPRQIIVKFVNRKKKEELLRAARSKAKQTPTLAGIFINEDLTDMRSTMAYLARKCERVKNVVTNNGIITCYLKETNAEGYNKIKRVSTPEELAELTGDSVGQIRKKLGLTQ